MLTLEEELQLSYYRRIGEISADHGVFLVQDIRSKKVCVQKCLTVYDAEIYRSLMARPIAHTPRILALAETPPVLTVIEEYIPGDTLQEILERDGPLEESAVLDITVQLCRIVEAFHRCSPPIVNRDIKPSNVMLTGEGTVCLLDMNAAKRCGSGRSRDTVLLGTQGYAAPEQYGFGASGVQTDIYAIGVLMRTLLTGRPDGTLPAGRLKAVIDRCTALSPDGRYRSAAALRAVLERLRGGRQKSAGNWQRYLPPGFRTGDPMRWALAVAGYALLFSLCATLQVENVTGPVLQLNRIFLTLILLAMVLFTGNYLDIQSRTRLTAGRHFLLRLAGILVMDTLILFAGVALMQLAVRLVA